MNITKLPFSNISVSEIGLGGMSLPSDEVTVKEVVFKALDAGINFIDTADLYQNGKNESNLGNILLSERKNVIIGSKVGNVMNPDGKSWHWDPSPAHIVKSIDESLKRLKTDYLDLYQLHGGMLQDPWEDIISTFEKLKEIGKIRSYGISSIRPNVIRKVMGLGKLSTIMMQYSPLDRRAEEIVFPFLENTETKILTRGALAKGLLIDKPLSSYQNVDISIVKEVKDMITELSFPNQATCIRFGLFPKPVGSLVIGASKVDQVEKMLSSYNLSSSISDNLIEELRQALPLSYYDNHR